MKLTPADIHRAKYLARFTNSSFLVLEDSLFHFVVRNLGSGHLELTVYLLHLNNCIISKHLSSECRWWKERHGMYLMLVFTSLCENDIIGC